MARTMWAPGVLWAAGIKLKVTGLENIQVGEPYIFVANHLSALDIPVLFRAVPLNLHFVAKKEVMWMPFVGWYMWATGMIFIDRSNRDKAKVSLEKAGELIKNGKHVIMFPEGTRSRNFDVMPFKKGPFVLSTQAGVAMLPVAISGTEAVLSGWRWLPFQPQNIVSVAIGPAMANLTQMDMTTYASEVREVIVGLKKGIEEA